MKLLKKQIQELDRKSIELDRSAELAELRETLARCEKERERLARAREGRETNER